MTSLFVRREAVVQPEPRLSTGARMRDIAAAVVTGQLSGIAMLLIMMAVAVFRGHAALVGMAIQVADVGIGMQLLAADQGWTHTFTGLWSWVYHLAFGLCLAAFPMVRRMMFRERMSAAL